MKIVVDKTIAFIEGVFEPYAEVVYKEGPSICREDIIDADALLIRTRTRCDAELLEGTSVKIIATCTVGMDNIDADYCREKGIFLSNAAGCNSGAVSNYVFSALYGSAARKCIQLGGASLGIIGLGASGQRVEEMGKKLGFRILRNDPKKAQEEWYTKFDSIDTILAEADIITLHVPLTNETKNMVNEEFLSKMKPGAILINTSNGDIVDEEALIHAASKLGAIIIDTWQNEPNVNRTLLELADIATPHISGYTLQGKQIATSMGVRTIARFFSISELYDYFPTTEIVEYQSVKLDLTGKTQGEITSIIQYNYPIFTDDFIFRMEPERFVELRSNYRYRREFFL